MWTQPSLTRRELLARTGCGFGMLALADLLATEAVRDHSWRVPREPRSLMRFERPITTACEAGHFSLHAGRAFAR